MQKELVLDRVINFFPNLWMDLSLNYDIDDSLSRSSPILVVFLNSALLALKLYQIDTLDDGDILILKGIQVDDEPDASWLNLIFTLQSVELILVLISVWNTISLLLLQYKKITLFRHPTESDFPESEYRNQWDLENRSRNAKLELLNGRLIWTLQVWSPSVGSLRLFTWFSPLQVLLIYLSSAENLGSLIPLAYITAITVYILIDLHQQSVIDSAIIAGELLVESKAAEKEIVFSKLTPSK